MHWAGTTHAVTNALVTFTVTGPIGGRPRISTLTNPTAWLGTVTARALEDGTASVYIKALPANTPGHFTVTARVGSGVGSPSVAFEIYTVKIFPVERIPRFVSSTTTGVLLKADRNYRATTVRTVDDILWPYSTPYPISVTRSSDHNEICMPQPVDPANTDSPYKWLRVSDGTVLLTMAIGGPDGFSKTTEPLVLMPTDTTTRLYDNYVVGSAAEHCAEQIDSRVLGKDPAALDMFSAVDQTSTPGHPNGIYVWNPACRAADMDLTCHPVWNSRLNGPLNLGCLVTPRIMLVADHNKPDFGNDLRFVDKTNKVWVTKVVGYVKVFSDLGFCVLDPPLPPDIRPAKVLGRVDHLGVENPNFTSLTSWGVPCLGMDRELKALVFDAAFQHELNPVFSEHRWVNAEPTKADRLKMYRGLTGGDSSSPCFLIKDGKPVLVALWEGGGPGSAPAVQHYLPELKAAMAAYRAGLTGVNIDPVDANWQLIHENFDNDGHGHDFPPF